MLDSTLGHNIGTHGVIGLARNALFYRVSVVGVAIPPSPPDDLHNPFNTNSFSIWFQGHTTFHPSKFQRWKFDLFLEK
jgi:hypothetical protein